MTLIRGTHERFTAKDAERAKETGAGWDKPTPFWDAVGYPGRGREIAEIAGIARHRKTKTFNHKGHEGTRRRRIGI
jgi:hypothetical protein